MKFLYLPFIVQGLVMFIDERIHLKRGLGLWERVGHPLDTLTVLVTFLFVINFSYNPSHFTLFLCLAVFSSLFITKDEFIHAEKCSPLEHWLHSLLFLLHPLTFICTAIFWKEGKHENFLVGQSILILIFMIYQIIRWSIPWKLEAK